MKQIFEMFRAVLIISALFMGDMSLAESSHEHEESEALSAQFPGFKLDSSTTQRAYANDTKVIPEGHVGYTMTRPSLLAFCYLTGGGFWECRQGPHTYGFTFKNLSIIPIDVSPNNFREGFILQTDDRLPIAFQTNATLRVSPKNGMTIEQTVKELVEKHGGQNWYEKTVSNPFKSIVRDAVLKVSAQLREERMKDSERAKAAGRKQSPPVIGTSSDIANDETMNGLEINNQKNRDAIESEINSKLQEFLKSKGYPIEVDKISVGNIQFPKSVQDAVNLTVQRKQELARKAIDREVADQDAAILLVKAKADSAAQAERNKGLTPLVIQQEAIRAWQEAMNVWSKSPNKGLYVMPIGQNGVPVVNTSDVEKGLKVEMTPAIQKQLDEQAEKN